MKNSTFLEHFDKKTVKKKEKLSIGDYIKVGFLFQEGEKERLQFFKGIIIAITGEYEKKLNVYTPGIYPIERIFSYQSPRIKSLNIIQSQKFRRSKLFYLRNHAGRSNIKNLRKI